MLFAVLVGLGLSTKAGAQTNTDFAYLALEPDIVTNYVGDTSRKLGYVRVTIELMINSVDNLEVAEHHMPLLRSTTIEIFGSQPEEKVKSLTGREDIRRAILKALQAHMKQETGGEVIKEVIFTKYLYQS
ncbi:flagellar basal body-associated protein FliL [Alteromonas sp. KUL49]|uniref:flagellar basal body-associated protein FliL n=1 Tax=Alteromonas sp. KUL49 TaxID=2480798 RepID=UPI00102F26B8|nr:flagellar basal body-associated protein FliL [Alteromonas sp. KUL49]TAP34296.1 flagellar basal body-associated protein FliL [Alteromonas sp. KUL49]GEA13590.1 flagellar basal body-associated protein FliL [Alteromonas sp. KUL49]